MLKRATRLLMLYLLILTIMFSATPIVYATPTDHPNTYVNTGNMRADIIGVALTQVGYYEGTNNDTKYGVWYGRNNLGWCGMFVAWCADQAGIPKSIIPKNGTTNPADFKVKVYSGKNFRPQQGDLFFSKSGSGYSHVGLVYYLDGDYFYTVEGNTYSQGPEGVYIKRRKIADYDFGVPNYTDSAKHSYQVGYETAHPHKEYYKCSHCGDQYYTGKTQTSDDCSDCIAANCSHSFGSWGSAGSKQHTRSCTKCGKKETAEHSWNSGTVTKQPSCAGPGENKQTCTACAETRTVSIPALTNHSYGAWKRADSGQHSRSCTKCGKKDTAKHTWNSGTVTKQPSCAGPGENKQTCTTCSATRTVSIPALTTHSYGAWEYLDDEHHIRSCQYCAKKETAAHRTADAWTSDQNGHWYSCADCSGRIREEGHSYGPECDAPCSTCGFLREDGHNYSTDWEANRDEHWHTCDVCGTASKKFTHMYDNPCDSICDTCGYDRQTKHSFPTELLSNAKGHWNECTLCGSITEVQPHEPGSAATEEQPQLCAVCGYELAPKLVHSHDYKPIADNALSHSMICNCGARLGSHSHTLDIATLRCSICGYEPIGSLPTLILLCAVPVTSLLFGLILLVHSLKRKIR